MSTYYQNKLLNYTSPTSKNTNKVSTAAAYTDLRASQSALATCSLKKSYPSSRKLSCQTVVRQYRKSTYALQTFDARLPIKRRYISRKNKFPSNAVDFSSWLHLSYNASADLIADAVPSGFRLLPAVSHSTPHVKRRALGALAPRLLALTSRYKLPLSAALSKVGSTYSEKYFLSGDYLRSRLLYSRPAPHWLSALRKEVQPEAIGHTFSRDAYRRVLRVRTVRRTEHSEVATSLLATTPKRSRLRAYRHCTQVLATSRRRVHGRYRRVRICKYSRRRVRLLALRRSDRLIRSRRKFALRWYRRAAARRFRNKLLLARRWARRRLVLRKSRKLRRFRRKYMPSLIAYHANDVHALFDYLRRKFPHEKKLPLKAICKTEWWAGIKGRTGLLGLTPRDMLFARARKLGALRQRARRKYRRRLRRRVRRSNKRRWICSKYSHYSPRGKRRSRYNHSQRVLTDVLFLREQRGVYLIHRTASRYYLASDLSTELRDRRSRIKRRVTYKLFPLRYRLRARRNRRFLRSRQALVSLLPKKIAASSFLRRSVLLGHFNSGVPREALLSLPSLATVQQPTCYPSVPSPVQPASSTTWKLRLTGRRTIYAGIIYTPTAQCNLLMLAQQRLIAQAQQWEVDRLQRYQAALLVRQRTSGYVFGLHSANSLDTRVTKAVQVKKTLKQNLQALQQQSLATARPPLRYLPRRVQTNGPAAPQGTLLAKLSKVVRAFEAKAFLPD